MRLAAVLRGSCPATRSNDVPSYTVRLTSYPSRPAEQASSILISVSCPAGQVTQSRCQTGAGSLSVPPLRSEIRKGGGDAARRAAEQPSPHLDGLPVSLGEGGSHSMWWKNRRSPTNSKPYYWAAFTLTGDPQGRWSGTGAKVISLELRARHVIT